MSSPRRSINLNHTGNVYAHTHDLLRLTYQQYVRTLPLSDRLPMISMLIQCFCTAPTVLAVWNQGRLHEYGSWWFQALGSSNIQRGRFHDLPGECRQRYPTVLTLADATGDETYTECLVLPLWYQQHYGGWIEVYASRWYQCSDDPQAVQFLGDLREELAAILVHP
jgi:hypothetical protein